MTDIETVVRLPLSDCEFWAKNDPFHMTEPLIYLLGHLIHHLNAFLLKVFDILVQIFLNLYPGRNGQHT